MAPQLLSLTESDDQREGRTWTKGHRSSIKVLCLKTLRCGLLCEPFNLITKPGWLQKEWSYTLLKDTCLGAVALRPSSGGQSLAVQILHLAVFQLLSSWLVGPSVQFLKLPV